MPKPRVIIIGDVMLDRYVSGVVERMSPEAPVPVVRVQEEWESLGGAANVAANAAAMGAETHLYGLVGEDHAYRRMKELVLQSGIHACLIESESPTVEKTRVMAGQQIVRIDREETMRWPARTLRELSLMMLAALDGGGVVLLSDYAKGMLSDKALAIILTAAKEAGLPVLADPKRADWSAYAGALVITPNLRELSLAAGRAVENTEADIVAAAMPLLAASGIRYAAITRSERGILLVGSDAMLNVPARALEVFDVSGAGDTVLAALGVAIAQGLTLQEAVISANAAAGVAVARRGTAVVSAAELASAMPDTGKVRTLENATKEAGVFTNGCFDVLHEGHLKLLREARAMGNRLTVGLNSDASIARLKGAGRPINPQHVRASVLASLPFVDEVVIFEEDTPEALIEALRPGILVKGGDYRTEDVLGGQYAGEVRIVPLVEGISTTFLLENATIASA